MESTISIGKSLEDYKRFLYATDVHPSSGCTACGNCYGRGPANWLADEHNTADWKCVPFDFYGWRRYTPSAFWEIATKYYHGLMDIDENVQETLFSCAQCGLCNEVCGEVQGNARLSDIFRTFRFMIYEKIGPLKGHATPIENTKKFGNYFGISSSAASWASDLGQDVTQNRKADSLLYVGEDCAYKLSQVAKAAAKVLAASGYDFKILENEPNSGYYLEMMGDRLGAEEMMRKNRQAFRSNGIKNVVCLSAQDYHIFRREMGSEFNVWHITELVSRLVSEGKVKPKKSYKKKIVFHDPCYLARQAGSKSPRERRVLDEPRNVLNSIPEIDLTELPKRGRWTWCAGECGGIKQGYPEMALWRAEKLIEQVYATGAEVLATATPNEQLHISEVLAKQKSNLQVMDTMEILAQCI